MNDPKGILDEVKKAVVGKDGVLVMALLAILAGGHILLEDIPGVGKTTMALAFSRVLDLSYSRMQFTPDVLPSDVTGYTILDYLNHVRIRHATNCFYYYDVPIGVIAENVGFITAVHFTRVFKKLVGISPSTFRNYYNLGSDLSESRRLTGNEVSAYDKILGVKILPLDDAVKALLELGKRTKQ